MLEWGLGSGVETVADIQTADVGVSGSAHLANRGRGGFYRQPGGKQLSR